MLGKASRCVQATVFGILALLLLTLGMSVAPLGGPQKGWSRCNKTLVKETGSGVKGDITVLVKRFTVDVGYARASTFPCMAQWQWRSSD